MVLLVGNGATDWAYVFPALVCACVPLRERVVLHYFTVADLQYLDPFEETEDNYEAGVAKYTMLNAEAMWILWSTLSCLDDMTFMQQVFSCQMNLLLPILTKKACPHYNDDWVLGLFTEPLPQRVEWSRMVGVGFGFDVTPRLNDECTELLVIEGT
jgi:hypothetical protein